MKKTACMLLALLLAFSAAAQALAATVSYEDGKVTVSQQDGVYMILIDGENTGKWVGAGMPSVTFDYPLEKGAQHVLVLLSLAGDGNIGAMETFWAGPTPEPTLVPTPAPTEIPTPAPTAEPTAEPAPEATEEPTPEPTAEPTAEPTPEIKGPVRIESASYEEETLSLILSGLRGYAEIWIDGKNTGFIVKENGPFSLEKRVLAGNHTVSLYSPAYNEVDSANFYVRFIPGPEIAGPEALGSLLKTAAGDAASYRMAYTSDENGVLLLLSCDDAEAEAEGISLYLSEDVLARLRNNGVGRVSLIYGDAELTVELDAVRPSLFATDKAIWYYVFSIARTPDLLYRVNVAAQTSLTDLTDAGYFSGVTLNADGNAVPVTLNGLY